MNAKLDPTLLPALKALFERGPECDPHLEQFKRACERDELARLHALPRATQPNPLDSCHDCGGYALHVTYRNGRAIGLCDGCY